MTLGSDARRGPTGRVIVTYLVSAACLSACITILFLAMRAVMDIGGYCAEGGPYEIAVHCPEGVAILMPLGIMGGMAAAFVMGAAGGRIGGAYGSLALLAWPAVFIALGWNFLDYGISPPPPAEGPVFGWLFTGVVFVIMGAAPLVLALGVVGAAGRQPRGQPPATLLAARATLAGSSAGPGPEVAVGTDSTAAAPTHGPDATVAEDLERLADLHRTGALDDGEYAIAKRRRLGGERMP